MSRIEKWIEVFKNSIAIDKEIRFIKDKYDWYIIELYVLNLIVDIYDLNALRTVILAENTIEWQGNHRYVLDLNPKDDYSLKVYNKQGENILSMTAPYLLIEEIKSTYLIHT